MTKRIYFTLLYILLTALTAMAMPADMIVVRYSTDDGLPSNTVYSTLKDHDGFLWLGTWYGLSSYDGTEFTPFVTRRNTSHDIPPRKVITIVEDKTNNLWIRTTDNRLYRFDKTTCRFNDMYSELRRVASNLRVIKIQQTSYGAILIYTRDKCLYAATPGADGKTNIKRIYNSKNDIDRTTMRLKHNVAGETQEYIYWLGPNFQIDMAAKPKNMTGKRMLKGIDTRNASCFARHGNIIAIGTHNGNATIIDMQSGKKLRIATGQQTPVNAISIIGRETYLSTDKGIYDSHGHLLATTNIKAETAFSDKYGNLWLYGLRDGLLLFNPKTKASRRFPTPQGANIDAVKFCDAGENGLFILLRNGKVWRYNRQKGEMNDINTSMMAGQSQITISPFLKEDTQPSTFSDIDIDKDGLLWLSSTGNGLFKVRFPQKQFEYLLPQLLKGDTTADNNTSGIRSLYQSRDGLLWIGTKKGNLYCVDLKSGKTVREYHGDFGSVYNIMEDRKGNVWLSSKGGGLIKATPDKSQPQGLRLTTFRHNDKDRYSLSDDKVYYTFQDSRQRIWVCTYGGGLNLIREQGGKTLFVNKNNEMKQLPQNDLYMNTRQIAEDNGGTLWVATTDGLLSFSGNFSKPNDIAFNNFRRSDNPTVVDNDIYSLIKDCRGNIWLSVFGCGLNKISRYDEHSGKLYLEALDENGLQGNIVATIAEDKRHRIWITSENGMSSISDNTLSVRTYGYIDGFLRSKVDQNTAICLNDGRIIIGARDGIIVFNPDEVEKEASHKYRTFITDFKVQNRSMESFDPPISQISPRYAKEITLRHDQNMFSIEFATLKFIGNSQTAFKYILDGYEREWHMNDNSRVASYANVPPGKYTFRVKPLDSDSPECTLRITILPPWWVTWWAYAIYFLLLCLAVYGGVRLALYMIRMRNEVYINDRLAELKIRFFTNISHELRTPLTLIKTPIAELRRHENLSPEGREYVKLIDSNAKKMLHLVNQILDFRKVQNGKMRLRISHADISAIAESFAEEYSMAAKERGIQLTFQLPEEPVMAWCDAEKIGVIINNLVSNAFKYTERGGFIRIGVEADENSTCRISVEDDGANIPVKQLEAIFERFSMAANTTSADTQQAGTGIGLNLSREYALMHHGRIWAENRTEGNGVVFTLVIPTDKEAFSADNAEYLINDNNAPHSNNGSQTIDNTGLAETDDEATDNNNGEEGKDGEYRPTLVLVEDNADMRRMLRLQLKRLYNVVMAEDGADGLEKIKAAHPDIIITDMMMPRMDGLELLRRVRQDFSVSHVPVIMLTAKNGDDDMMRAISTGANAYITKPFSNDMLMARIRQLLQEQTIFQRKMVLQAKTTAEPAQNAADEYEQHLAQKDLDFISRIHSIIEENLQNEDFNINTIAETIGLSRSAFFKKLKSLTGLAPVDLVKEIRLGKAEQLIMTTDKSVAEIAYAVGFRESSYFGKCFKKKFGMTPLEYRMKDEE